MNNAINNFKKYQFLLGELVKKDIKLKYRSSYLGIVWTLLEPILTTVVLTLVFSGIYEKGKGDTSFPVYILSGRLLYTAFANSTKAAMKSIRSNSAMIKKVYVPKYMYPFASILSNYVTFLISLIVLFGAMFIFKVYPTLYLFEIIVPLFLVLILSMGVGLILSTLAVFFRDLEYLWSVALMMIMYTCAIFYDIERINMNGAVYKWIFRLNPVYNIIVNFRDAIFGRPLNTESLMVSVIFSLGCLIVGVWMFYKKQDEFILNI